MSLFRKPSFSTTSLLIWLAIECCYLYCKQLYTKKKEEQYNCKNKKKRKTAKQKRHSTICIPYIYIFVCITDPNKRLLRLYTNAFRHSCNISVPTREYKLSKQNMCNVYLYRYLLNGREYSLLVLSDLNINTTIPIIRILVYDNSFEYNYCNEFLVLPIHSPLHIITKYVPNTYNLYFLNISLFI